MIGRALGVLTGADAIRRAAVASAAYHAGVGGVLLRLARRPGSDGTRPSRWLMIALALAVVGLLLPFVAAAAQAAVQAAAGAGVELNPALRIIALLYSDTPTPLTRAVWALSRILLAGAAGVIGWNMLGAIHYAAERGEVLSWSGLAVVRGAVAVCLLAPFPPVGLSGIHYVLRFALEQSVAVADTAAAAFVAETLGVEDAADTLAPVQTLGIPVAGGGVTLARQVLVSEICGLLMAWDHERYNDSVGSSGAALLAPLPHSPLPPVGGQEGGGLNHWRWGRFGSCGVLSLPATVVVGDDRDPVETLEYKRARIAALAELVSATRAARLPESWAAIKYGRPLPSTLLPQMRALADKYDAAVMRAAADFEAARHRGSRRAIVDAVRAQGWPALGATWATIAGASAAAGRLAAQPPVRRAPSEPMLEMEMFWLPFVQMWERETSSPELTPDALSAEGDAESSLMARIINPVTKPLTQKLISWAEADTLDPVHEMVGVGHWLTGAAEIGYAATLIAAPLSCNVASSAAGVCDLFHVVSNRVDRYLWTLEILGVIHSIILPALPYIGMVMALLSFALASLELLIAAPVLVFLAARLDGQEFVHAVFRPGLILVASAVMRPIFVVLAFIGSFYLLPEILGFLNRTYAAQFFGGQAGFTIGISQILGSIILLTWIQWQIVVRVFGAIHEVPDRLLAYFGGSGQDGAAEWRVAGAATGAALGASLGSGGGSNPGGGSSPGGGGLGGGGLGGGASRVPTGGGGAPGVRPSNAMRAAAAPASGGGAAAGGGEHWSMASGGMSPSQQRAAAKAWSAYQEKNPGHAADLGDLDGYVAHVQGRESERGAVASKIRGGW